MATTDPSPTFTEPRRFSVRLPRPMWIGVAAIAMLVVSVGLRIGLPIYRQQVAIRQIRRLGGNVDIIDGGPKWLRKLIGDARMEMFGTPEQVVLARTPVTDLEMRHVAALTTLGRLNLRDTQVTDAGLVHIAGLTNLQALELIGTPITDAGLVHLGGLARLESLYLDRTEIGDEGLTHLTRLGNLNSLYIRESRVTNEGIAKLKRTLPQLGAWN